MHNTHILPMVEFLRLPPTKLLNEQLNPNLFLGRMYSMIVGVVS